MIIAGFIIALIMFLVGSMLGAMEAENLVQKATENVFQIEKVITGWFENANVLDDLLNFVLSIAVSIAIFKLLKKILEIYVTGTEGDDTESPFFLVVNFIRTMFAIFLYRPFFDWFVDIYKTILDKITVIAGVAKNTLNINIVAELNRLWREKQLTDFDTISGQIRALTNTSQGPYNVTDIQAPMNFNFLIQVMWFILLVMILTLYIRLISRGVELYLIKLGFPIAAVGLMDNDKGIFKDYFMLFLQALTTIIVQIFLLNLALISMVAMQGNYDIFSLSLSIAITSLAISTPELLSKFLVSSRGGSGRGASMMMNMLIMTSRMAGAKRPKTL